MFKKYLDVLSSLNSTIDLREDPIEYSPTFLTPVYERVCHNNVRRHFSSLNLTLEDSSISSLEKTVVLANHQHDLDISIITECLRFFKPTLSKKHLTWLAKSSLENYLRLSGVFPLVLPEDFKKTIKNPLTPHQFKSARNLKRFNTEFVPSIMRHNLGNDYNVVIFPEGNRNYDGCISSISNQILETISSGFNGIDGVSVMMMGIKYHGGAQMCLNNDCEIKQDISVSLSKQYSTEEFSSMPSNVIMQKLSELSDNPIKDE